MPKEITSINGPVIIATGEDDFAMHEMVLVGKERLMGEVINLEKENAIIQVYEETSGLKIGEQVIGKQEPLSVWLGPGLIGNIFDGIQRPLPVLKHIQGDFMQRGSNIPALDAEKKWIFLPKVKQGDKVQRGTLIGEVQETKSIIHKILYPYKEKGIVKEIQKKGEYTITDTIASIQTEQEESKKITMLQKWPVRKPRPYQTREAIHTPLITGQRVIDSIFPIAKGGTAAIPGGFGTGKTMLQHQIAKWSDADIIIYIGCGERGNEMTEVLEDFPKLKDPKTGRPLMERTILIANTSNMPVAAREASIYTGITLAEYYRDMGYDTAILADSTSRWAEALREISGRLEEMPAEEGFPSYLPSRLSEFYGRAGLVRTLNGEEGSVSIIGAVSPQGADFSEPVTQNTKRFVNVFWGLDRNLAYSRHYPAINWMISYSEYVERLEDWYIEHVDINFFVVRQKIVTLLQEESELLEIAKVVGQEVLTDEKRLILETCKSIRIGFLQQSALDEIDTFVPIQKQYKMMESILVIYETSLSLIQKGIPLSEIKKLGYFERYMKLKFEIENNNLEAFQNLQKEIKKSMKELEQTYTKHLQ